MAKFGNKHKISEEKRLLHNRTAKEGKYDVLRKPKIAGGKVEEIIQCQLCEKATRRNGHLMEWLKKKCPKLEPKIEGKRFSEEQFGDKWRNLLVRVNNAGHSVSMDLATKGSADVTIKCDKCGKSVPTFRRVYELIKTGCNKIITIGRKSGQRI